MSQTPPQGPQYPQQGQPQPPQGPQQGYQQFPQQPPPPKKKRRGLLIVGIVVAVVLFGCIGSALALLRVPATTSSTVIGTVSTSVTPTPPPPQAKNYTIGDVVKVGDAWDVTILSAKADQGSTIFQPKSGMQYLILHVAMQNLTTKNHSISSILQFTLRSDDGTKYNHAFYAPDGTTVIDGSVDGGQPAKGILSFEVPTTSKMFHLNFESNPYDAASPRATWDIPV